MSPRITLYIEAAHPQKLLFWCGKYKTSEKTQRDVSISKKDLSLLLLFGIIYPICRELLQFFFKTWQLWRKQYKKETQSIMFVYNLGGVAWYVLCFVLVPL